jgi:hypothetical protein
MFHEVAAGDGTANAIHETTRSGANRYLVSSYFV